LKGESVPIIRIIGDVHGDIAAYRHVVEKAECSIQVGDMGFKCHYEKLSAVDPERHKFIPGNHDDYDNLPRHAILGDHGIARIGDFRFFFVRGAESVDKAVRTLGMDWWMEEEISYQQGLRLFDAWEETSADIVITHDAPSSIASGLVDDRIFLGDPPTSLDHHFQFKPSRTNEILQQMLEIRQPKLWIFGHWHVDRIVHSTPTTFISLGKLAYIDLQYPRRGSM